MQQTQASIVPSGGIQSPLLSVDQLQPGVILTGVAAVNNWKVVELGVGDLGEVVKLEKIPAGIVNMRTHPHSWTTRGRGQECTCGARIQPVSTFLPLHTNGKARTYVIAAPPEGLRRAVPDAIYVYVKADGRLGTVRVNALGQWSTPLPIMPQLHQLWALPAELQVILGSEPVDVENEDEHAPPTMPLLTPTIRFTGIPVVPAGATYQWIGTTFATATTTTATTATPPVLPTVEADDDDDLDEDAEDDDLVEE